MGSVSYHRRQQEETFLEMRQGSSVGSGGPYTKATHKRGLPFLLRVSNSSWSQ